MKQELLKFNQAEAVQLVNGLLIKKIDFRFHLKNPPGSDAETGGGGNFVKKKSLIFFIISN